MTAMSAWDRLRDTALACTACSLSKTRTMVVFGTGNIDAAVMVVGEGPGAQEDLAGEPFVGRSGRLLTRLLEEVGLTREAVCIANVVKCRPPENRNPRPEEIYACRPYLEAQIDIVAPIIIVTLGNVATRALLNTKSGITELRGQTFPYRGNAVVIPTLHPAAVLRGGAAALQQTRSDFLAVSCELGRRGTRQ